MKGAHIRAQTPDELRKALRHAADVCIEYGRICWSSIDVTRSDGSYHAAHHLIDAGDVFTAGDYASTPLHAALFLDLAAVALGDL